ncbi:MAG TPA: MarR family transcriptional regulator [Pedobacter sp.]
MNPNQKSELVGEFCQSIFELRYKLRKMFQVKLKETGISISFEVLEAMKFLQGQDGMNQQELADMLFKDKSSMTYLIDNMVKSGWALRKEDKTDRRNKLIFLTDKARQLKEQLVPLAVHCYLALAEDVDTDEIKRGIQMLSRMNNALSGFII